MTGLLGTAQSTLGNIQLGHGGLGSLIQSVTDTLALVQTAKSGQVNENIADSLVLVQTAVGNKVHSEAVSQALAFVQTVGQGDVRLESVSSVLALAQTVGEAVFRHASVLDTLALVQTVRPSIIHVSVADAMALTQVLDHRGPIYEQVQHILHFADQPKNNPPHQFVSDFLGLVDVAGRALHVTVTDVMALTQDGHRFTGAVDFIAFTDLAQAGKGPPAPGVLDDLSTLTDVATCKLILNLSISHALGLNEALSYLLVNGCTRLNYSPFVGSGGDPSYTAPSAAAPTLGTGTLTLTYPFVSPTSTVVLRNPEFQNRDRLNFNRINRETRGGTLIVFADTAWPKSQALVLQIRGLRDACSPQVAALQTFLAASLGQEIGLLDYENRQWRGVITNPDVDVVQDGLNSYSISIEFQGTLA